MRTSQNTSKQSSKGPQKKNVFTKYMQEKLAITVLVITLALFALIYVLYDIVNANQDEYNQIVLNQQEYDSRVIPYRRGDIVDRNGTILATTEKVYNLIIDPKQIMSDAEDFLEPTISALNTAYGYDSAEIRTLITENEKKAYIRYARQLTLEEKKQFDDTRSSINQANIDAGSKGRVKGVWFEEEYKRTYPYDSLACNVVGFATGDGAGGSGGIEQYYNSSLIGNNGREYGYLNDDSNLERVTKQATNGDTVVSTIDVKIQGIIENHIKAYADEPGADRVAVVVMNPQNGEILAMASDQRFDLNNPREVSSRFTEEELLAFGQKEAMDTYNRSNPDKRITLEQVDAHYSRAEILSFGQQVAWNQVWRNFAVSDTFEPGSPSKIFTVSAGLEEGVINGSETFICDGYQEVGGHTIKCVKRTGHGPLTVTESLMQSCNDAMMQIAAIEGKNIFGKYQRLFGFGSKTGIDLPGEADTSKLIYTEENLKPSDLATNAFGQNYNCTMIQMVAAYASVINGGSYYEPHVVKQVLNEQGAIVKKSEPVLVRETVSESTSNFIKEALYRTVTEGTGKSAAIAGYEIAGKTGTAEKLPRGTRDYLVSFCGFAPAMDPQVLVYVIIDTPHVEDQPHSSYAGIVFQGIMDEILPYLNIFKESDDENTPDEIATQLPVEEGISGSNGELPAESEAPKVYETEEYIDPNAEGDGGIPGDMPGTPEPYETSSIIDIVGAGVVPSSDGVRAAGASAATTAAPTTAAAETAAAQTEATSARTTAARTTAASTTKAETTKAETTKAATTRAATQAETSPAPTTKAPATAAPPVGPSVPPETQPQPTEAAATESAPIPIVEPRP